MGYRILRQGWYRQRAESNAGAVHYPSVFCSPKGGKKPKVFWVRFTLKIYFSHFSTWREESVRMTRRYLLTSSRYYSFMCINLPFLSKLSLSLGEMSGRRFSEASCDKRASVRIRTQKCQFCVKFLGDSQSLIFIQFCIHTWSNRQQILSWSCPFGGYGKVGYCRSLTVFYGKTGPTSTSSSILSDMFSCLQWQANCYSQWPQWL